MKTIMGDYINRHEGAPSLEAIAWGLSRIPRFTGHTTGPWTVAHHSIVALRIATVVGNEARLSPSAATNLGLAALLHDAHESVTSDVPTEFKTPGLKGMQKALDARIAARYHLGDIFGRWHETVAQIDTRALLAEAYIMTPRETFARIAADHALVPGTSRCSYEPDNGIVRDVRDAFGEWDPSAIQYYLLNAMRYNIPGSMSL